MSSKELLDKPGIVRLRLSAPARGLATIRHLPGRNCSEVRSPSHPFLSSNSPPCCSRRLSRPSRPRKRSQRAGHFERMRTRDYTDSKNANAYTFVEGTSGSRHGSTARPCRSIPASSVRWSASSIPRVEEWSAGSGRHQMSPHRPNIDVGTAAVGGDAGRSKHWRRQRGDSRFSTSRAFRWDKGMSQVDNPSNPHCAEGAQGSTSSRGPRFARIRRSQRRAGLRGNLRQRGLPASIFRRKVRTRIRQLSDHPVATK